MTPPAISKAGSVMPKMRKMYCPMNANVVSTTKAVSEALRAVRTRRAGVSPSVTARKVGRAAKGSTRKKIELSASKEKRTYAEPSIRVKVTLCGSNITP